MAKRTAHVGNLKNVARNQAARYLDQPNVTSVGVAYKVKKGKVTKELCIQFTVGHKVAIESLDNEGLQNLPEFFEINGVKIPTDIIECDYEPSAMKVAVEEKSSRKVRMDPLMPGASIGHTSISAGTAGCIVFGSNDGQEYLLSNWHVLHGATGAIGETIVQPGKYDDDRIEANAAGTLVRSHLGVAGDCAIAKIDQRDVEPEIMELGVKVSEIADPDIGDKVVKSGRTTGVTYGIVSRIYVTVRLNYGAVGSHNIGCFEYVPDPAKPPADGEVSKGGDSGSAVMLVKSGKPTPRMLGLHFAGEVGNAPEHGLACYASSVFEKLELSPQPPAAVKIKGLHGTGYDWHFLSKRCSPPYPANTAASRRLLSHGGEKVFDYTHFSLVIDEKRKFAPWVAWNIDGASIKRVSRDGISFVKDPKLPASAQIGNELYKYNPLDRGHVARRADLCWGTISEARKANKDSFFYTNMTPQHARFNQSGRGGVWGNLENATFEAAKIQDLRVSVFGGPVLDSNDPVYRTVQIPREFWKVICYVDDDTNTLLHHAFLLTQADLIRGLEALDLDEFKVFEVPIQEIADRIGFTFRDLEVIAPEALDAVPIRRVSTVEEVLRPRG